MIARYAGHQEAQRYVADSRRWTYDKDKNTVADDGNIKTSVDNGAVKVSLSDKINLHQGGYLTVGGDTRRDKTRFSSRTLALAI